MLNKNIYKKEIKKTHLDVLEFKTMKFNFMSGFPKETEYALG